MNTNDLLKRLRFAVKISDAAMMEALALGGSPLSREKLDAYFLKEEEEGYALCPHGVLEALLDGMIAKKRGAREEAQGSPAAQRAPAAPLDNNMILKKLRIAFELKEEDLLEAMRLGGVELSKNELSAFFRRKDQKNYKECMDQFLRNFLAGLAKLGKARY
ncbi:MAG TPA: DUF1456 domain-containing protein [Spirochaetaceae bacterium]|jgi:uncharacterized protein YehS (DUF1456 family)|nr:DUF1456 domain-containing protein [Spirochaetaceae bacterium]